MMRYQRVSPDYNPLSNGPKSSFRCKDDGENGSKSILNNGGGFRFRSPSKPPPQPPSSQEINSNNHYNSNNNSTTTSASSPLSDNNHHNRNGNGNGSRGGDVLLQWGHKKRARLSRTEIRSLADDSSSSSSIHRRGGSPFIDKAPAPPPPLPLPLPQTQHHNVTSTSSRASNLRTKDSSGFINNRNLEDRSGAGNGSPSRNLAGGIGRGVSRSAVSKGSHHSSEKLDKKMKKEEKTTNGFLASTRVQLEQEDRGGLVVAAAAATAIATTTNTVVSKAEKVSNVEVMEWPKIFIALSRKEKEDDFLAMKGTKLPHRPKKRAKNIDRTLQYCFPGMWLSDLTKSRYEVREKKSVKKQKRRGLKGMESMESDSE